MKLKHVMIFSAAFVGLMPACVSNNAPEEPEPRSRLLSTESYGILDREDEVYPWLAPEYDKGIYASSAPTAPFRDNGLTTENLRKRIQKTSKKSKK